ncbi:MAG TPA: sulfatase-like hydrolase/transferase [Flavipsychrobacter sp.]|nr:sulfatase-like hydrolase/transferase [Flavipsychrobacter sp.]
MPRWQKFTPWLFIAINAIAFSFEISDWAYFPFTAKRATNDVLDMITRKSDFIALLPHFITTYWYAPLGIFLLVFLLYKANKWIQKKTPIDSNVSDVPKWMIAAGQTIMLILASGLCVIGMRGGLQLIPIGNGNALQVTDNKFVAIVLNTPFSIMHSYSGKVEEVHFFSEEELKKYFNPVKNYAGKSFQKKNVVVIILESFSKEYTGLGGRKSFTPFLDSLMPHSFVFRNAYANALHSAEGIPAILSGIPSLMNEPFTTSSYGTNKLTSLPQLLKDKGYKTAFYHGGTNGTMSFDIYASNAGFDKYHGRKEYNNEADYDGHWGIWDEPFLQYCARSINSLPQPFMTSVFTLTSHDPFEVPQQYKGTLPTGALPVQQTIAYTDQSLRKFFQTASKQSWFENTLFVITSDHTAPSSKDPYYSSLNMGVYAIPIIFYAPGDTTLKGSTDTVFQHIDILPTVLDYLGYDQPFFSFGNSAFRSAYPRFVINELSGKYQWYMNDYFLTANELKPAALYHFKTDSLCRNNILQEKNEMASQELIPYFKAFIQLYRASVIRNKLSL